MAPLLQLTCGSVLAITPFLHTLVPHTLDTCLMRPTSTFYAQALAGLSLRDVCTACEAKAIGSSADLDAHRSRSVLIATASVDETLERLLRRGPEQPSAQSRPQLKSPLVVVDASRTEVILAAACASTSAKVPVETPSQLLRDPCTLATRHPGSLRFGTSSLALARV